MKKLIIILLFLMLFAETFCQKNFIDSLLKVIENTNVDTIKINRLNELFQEYRQTDTIKAIECLSQAYNMSLEIKYNHGLAGSLNNKGNLAEDKRDYKTALNYYTTALEINLRNNDKSRIGNSFNKIGAVNYFLGNYAEANKFYNKSIEIRKQIKEYSGAIDCNNNIAKTYIAQEKYSKALKTFQQSIILAKNHKVYNKVSEVYNSIGGVFRAQFKHEEAIYYYLLSLNFAQKINDIYNTAVAYRNIGLTYQDQGEFYKALQAHKKHLDVSISIQNKKEMAHAYNNLSSTFHSLGNFTEAINNQMKSLKIYEELGNKKGIAGSYNNIGNVFCLQGNYTETLKNYTAALKINEEIGNKSWAAINYNNMGIVYFNQKNYNEALKNLYLALKIREELKDKIGIAETKGNIGLVCKNQKKYNEALNYYKQSYEIMSETGNKSGIAATLLNIGTVYIEEKKYPEAKSFLEKSINLSNSIGQKHYLREAYLSLQKLFYEQGNFKGAYENYKLYSIYKDSLNNEESQKKTIQTQMTYEFEKKEAVAAAEHKKEMENQKAIADEKSRKQSIVILFIVLGLLLVMVFAGFIFRSLRITRKQKNTIEKQKLEVDEKNLQLNQQNEEIRTQRDEIEAQRDEIEAQRDIVTMQKEELEEIYKEVTDSINYARRIQEAVLPVSENSRAILGEHFILFKPKDIVSGDFYWTTKVNNWLIIAVADCTGHGVPGAFMSMLGISFLNEIVQKKEVRKAGQILNILRTEIINALQQKGIQGEQKDGMDISLLVVNTDTNECQWAGANNPLYIIRKFDDLKTNQFESDKSSSNLHTSQLSNQFIELKGDKMPIAIHPVMNDFTNHEFTLQNGDSVYLFTDGYADQFGGPKGRKFMYKQFKEMLIQNRLKSMRDQKEKLEKTFDKWQSGHEQIDDVTVLGFKLQ